jgi:outer membrane protein
MAQQAPRVWSLDSCINQAVAQNLKVRQSELNLQASRVTNVQAKAAFLPVSQFNGSHSFNTGRSIDPFTNQPTTDQIQANDFGLFSSITLFNGLQLQHQLQQSKLGVKASQYELEQTRQTIALNVTLAYLDVLFNQELVVIADNQLKNSLLQVERSKRLVAADALAASTLADLEVQSAQDELQQVTAATNLKTAKLLLLQLLNLPATTPFNIEPIATEVPATNPYSKTAAEIIALAEKTQPSIIGADLRVQSAKQGVKSARAGLLPTLSLSGYLGSNYSSAVPTTRFVADGTGYTVREVPSETNFNALITEKTTEYAAQNARLELRQNIELAYNNLEAAQVRFRTATRQVNASKIAYDAAQKRFDSGSVHYVDLNLAKTNFDKALSNQVQAKYDYLFRQRILDFYLQSSIK